MTVSAPAFDVLVIATALVALWREGALGNWSKIKDRLFWVQICLFAMAVAAIPTALHGAWYQVLALAAIRVAGTAFVTWLVAQFLALAILIGGAVFFLLRALRETFGAPKSAA